MFLAGQVSRWVGRDKSVPFRWIVLALGALCCWQAVPRCMAAEVPPRPMVRLSLNDLGFPGYSLSLLHAGASMATVNVLDSSHVLFTYSLRSLVPRLPGDDVNDTDRQVAAVLVDVPSGHVLARARWRLHDHGRYLWRVGHGVFVVRSGNELSLLAPSEALAASAPPLTRYALPHRPGMPVAVEGSPDGKVITVELQPANEKPVADEAGDPEPQPKHYTIEFFRLAPSPAGKGMLQISGAGAVNSPALLNLPLDGDGYLWAEDGQHGTWQVAFNEFGGKQQPLAPVLSACRPRLSLLSRSEFLAETCRGAMNEPMLSAYGFDGHENWEEQFGDELQRPSLALAPAAGRFAISRLISSSGTTDTVLGGDDPISQEIRVYQTESGDLLLRLQCSPAVRSAENFDLSPDGRTLAVLGPETLDLYRLPELSARDRKDLADVQTMVPPAGEGPVMLGRITRPVVATEMIGTPGNVHTTPAMTAATSKEPLPSPGVKTHSTAAEADRPVSVAGIPQTAGSDEAAAPRKRPTLLNPGETPEFKGSTGGPQ